MGFSEEIGKARSQTMCVVSESAYGEAAPTFVAGNSVRVIGGISHDFTQETEKDTTVRQNRGRVATLDRRRTGGVNFSTPAFMPGGALIPEIDPLLRAAGFIRTTGASDNTYALTTTGRPESAAILVTHPRVYGAQYSGVGVNTINFSFPADGEPVIEWETIAQDRFNSTSNATTAAGDGDVTPFGNIPTNPISRAKGYGVNALINIGTSTNHRITALNLATGSLIFAPNVTTNVGANPTIVPYSPYDDSGLVGTRAGLTSGSAVINGETFCVQSGNIQLSNNLNGTNCFGSATIGDISLGDFDVEGSLVLTGSVSKMAKAFEGQTPDSADRIVPLDIYWGDNSVAGNPIFHFDMNVVLGYPEMSIPDDGDVEVTISFMGQDTSSGNDAFVLISTTST